MLRYRVHCDPSTAVVFHYPGVDDTVNLRVLCAAPGSDPRVFHECSTTRYQRFTISNCPCSQVIRIQSAEVGFSGQCSLNEATCTRQTNHTEIRNCNGVRSCRFSSDVLNYPPDDKLCDEHQNGNFIRITYDCLNGE